MTRTSGRASLALNQQQRRLCPAIGVRTGNKNRAAREVDHCTSRQEREVPGSRKARSLRNLNRLLGDYPAGRIPHALVGKNAGGAASANPAQPSAAQPARVFHVELLPVGTMFGRMPELCGKIRG